MSTSLKNIPPNKISSFPVTLFSIIMGLAGVTLMYMRATHVLGYPPIISQVLSGITITIFTIITVIYILKFFIYKNEVLTELKHPVKSVFFGAIAVSFLLVATILAKQNLPGANIIWWIGAILEFSVTCYCLSFWINQDMQLDHVSPAWMIPIVGNLIAPFGGVDIVTTPVLMFFFSIGIFFWLTLMPMLLNRIIFHDEMAEHFLPTLFILIAPPAAGLIAYLNVNGHQVDFFANFLYNIALFFTLLIMFMYKKFMHIKFFISCWAFIFPLAAMTVATQVMFASFKLTCYYYLAQILIIITTTLLIVIGYQTLKRAINGSLFITN